MFERMKKAKQAEGGFTLIELLVVIAILGILAGVVVISVRGITNRGQASACRIDKREIATAEEASFSQGFGYTDQPTLVTNGFLQDVSTLHTVALAGGGYTIADVAPCP